MPAQQHRRTDIPRHIAIIMDGNGRWAKQRSLKRIMGHRKGIDAVRLVVQACRKIGVEILTLYAFSTENWARPKTEVRALMGLLKRYVRLEIDDLDRNNIRVQAIGDLQNLPGDVVAVLQAGIEQTRANTGMVLNVALSYSGRDELVRAMRRIARDVERGVLAPEAITEASVAGYLDTAGQLDPDLLIRTSGELRVSNFLLWQIAYTELYVTDVLWPDFSEQELHAALENYRRRQRRFGLTGEQVQSC